MSYQVLARKWRPRTFAELAGQSHVVRALGNALEQNRLHHAWLFTGTRGVGKTTIARILAKALNCETGITAHPCGECTACRQIDAGRFVDLIELDAASNTGIDNMREVLDNAQYAPTAGRFKVYIIDEVHMLSKAAFNSMLKTLEEPPGHVKFILATTDPQKIPVTVLSRCLQFNLKQMPPELVAKHLEHILSEERIPAEAAALQRIAHAAHGSMRDALSLLDQAIAYGGEQVLDADVQHMLGGLDRSDLLQLLDALADRDGTALLERSARLLQQGVDAASALQEIARLLHQIALFQTVPEALDEALDERAAIEALAARLDSETVQLYYQICLLGRRDLPLAPDETAGFNMVLLRMLAFHPETSTGGPAGGNTARLQPAPGATRTAASALTAARAQTAPTRTMSAAEPSSPVAAPQPQVTEPPPAVATSAPVTAASTGTATGTATSPAASLVSAQDWIDLIAGLKLGGQARMLATECELAAAADTSIRLRLAQAHRHLAEPSYQTRLAEALGRHFGQPIRLEIDLCEQIALSPQRQQSEQRAQRQLAAEQLAQDDRFVQESIEQFGARVIAVHPTHTNQP